MSNEFQMSSKSSWFPIDSSVLPNLSGGNGESSVIKSTREDLPRSFKRAEINHTKIPTCKSDRSKLGAASTRESCCYKISVRGFVTILTTKHIITFDIISSSKPAAKVKFPGVMGNDVCACKDT